MAWDWDKLQEQRKKSSGGGGPGTSPSMEEVFEKIKGAKKKFPGGTWLIIVAIILIFLGSSCFYTVAVDEVGVIQRFGKYVRTTQPGLNFKLPRGIETITKVKVKYVFKEEFGFRTVEPGVRTRYASDAAYETEALMLTGDLNVAVVPWIVQYRLKDPYKYLFKVRDIRSTFRDLAEASMRLVVGDSSINEVISKREELALKNRELLQKYLDEAETGIQLVTVEMKRTNVPEPVQPSFNEVNQAVQEKERLIYQAKEAYNKVIPAAKGDAEKTIKAAEGYALQRVNRAQGDAARFLDLYEAYAKSEDVTRRRLYLEAMETILPKFGSKYVVDADQKNFLPLLTLGKSEGGKK
jgi:modulator of FtsH protease HflK